MRNLILILTRFLIQFKHTSARQCVFFEISKKNRYTGIKIMVHDYELFDCFTIPEHVTPTRKKNTFMTVKFFKNSLIYVVLIKPNSRKHAFYLLTQDTNL